MSTEYLQPDQQPAPPPRPPLTDNQMGAVGCIVALFVVPLLVALWLALLGCVGVALAFVWHAWRFV